MSDLIIKEENKCELWASIMAFIREAKRSGIIKDSDLEDILYRP